MEQSKAFLKQRIKRFRLMGKVFIALAFLGTAFALFTENSPESKLGFYALAILFIVMGLICFTASWKLKISR